MCESTQSSACIHLECIYMQYRLAAHWAGSIFSMICYASFLYVYYVVRLILLTNSYLCIVSATAENTDVQNG